MTWPLTRYQCYAIALEPVAPRRGALASVPTLPTWQRQGAPAYCARALGKPRVIADQLDIICNIKIQLLLMATYQAFAAWHMQVWILACAPICCGAAIPQRPSLCASMTHLLLLPVECSKRSDSLPLLKQRSTMHGSSFCALPCCLR